MRQIPLTVALISILISFSANAKDLSGDYRITSSVCVDPSTGISAKSHTGTGSDSTGLKLKKSGDDLSYEATLDYWGKSSSELKLSKVDNETYSGTFLSHGFTMISRANALTIVEPVVIEGAACPKGTVIMEAWEKIKFLGIF